MKQKVLIVLGPTASGKSALGVRLAKVLDGEIISADSRQVYKGLDVGTGKITTKEMKGVPHHLLDVASPKKMFSAGDFVKLGRAAIQDITKRGKLPIVVGGTGFYIDALVGRIALPEVAPNPLLRKRLASKSPAQLFALLRKKDSVRAATLDTPSERNNKARLIRALEISHSLGKSPASKSEDMYAVLWIGTRLPDPVLKKKIGARLSARIKAGMLAEARRLKRGGLSYKRMEELGLEYRSLARFLKNEILKTELETELRSDIWRYSRKQIGYWKRNTSIQWFDPKSKKIAPLAKTWLKK